MLTPKNRLLAGSPKACDPVESRKSPVAQTYFAIQTRRAESDRALMRLLEADTGLEPEETDLERR